MQENHKTGPLNFVQYCLGSGVIWASSHPKNMSINTKIDKRSKEENYLRLE